MAIQYTENGTPFGMLEDRDRDTSMFQISAHRKTPRFAKLVAAFAVSATTLLVAGCSSEAGDLGSKKIAAADRTVDAQFAQSNGGLVQSAPINSLTGSAVRQRFFSVPRPAEVTANSYDDLGETLLYARRATEADPKKQNGGKWIEAAQIGLLFGAPEGKAFLTAPAGRALVRGEPAESCPSLNVATAPTDDQATEGAMRACLRQVAARPDCGCRVIARADRLLAKRDEFQYAIGVSSHLVDPSTGRQMRMTAEERIIEGRPGVRRLWMLGAAGPVGMLQVEQDGRAAFVFSGTGKRFDGSHVEDGFRRGRIARRAYLTAKDGKRLVVLVGFEESELKENSTTLLTWNPFGPLELKKAEAN